MLHSFPEASAAVSPQTASLAACPRSSGTRDAPAATGGGGGVMDHLGANAPVSARAPPPHPWRAQLSNIWALIYNRPHPKSLPKITGTLTSSSGIASPSLFSCRRRPRRMNKQSSTDPLNTHSNATTVYLLSYVQAVGLFYR